MQRIHDVGGANFTPVSTSGLAPGTVGLATAVAVPRTPPVPFTDMPRVHTWRRAQPEKPAVGHRYMPGLDGLRAVAVLAVIAYHLGFSWAAGGLLGVTVFFVLSGYLITDLLLSEWARTGRVDLRAFWYRRARRLLPALYAMLFVVLAYLTLLDRAELPALRGQVLAAFLYLSNWWLIFHHVSYFASFGPPSPLGHLWSLAIEEQFYLLWPLLLMLGLRKLAAPRRLLVPTVGLAALSAFLMAALYTRGIDPTRVYDGTDTRAFSLLIGCSLALVWRSDTLRAATHRVVSRLLDAAGAIALLGLLVMVYAMNQYAPFLYRGGMALASLAAVVLVAAATHPASRWGTWLGARPLRWIGARSYGIYLWHYPIILLTTPLVDTNGPQPWRAALQVGATILLAALSWRYVEVPVRQGALGRLWHDVHRLGCAPLLRRTVWPRWVGAGVVGSLALAGLSGVLGTRPAPDPAVTATSVLTTPSADPAVGRQSLAAFSLPPHHDRDLPAPVLPAGAWQAAVVTVAALPPATEEFSQPSAGGRTVDLRVWQPPAAAAGAFGGGALRRTTGAGERPGATQASHAGPPLPPSANAAAPPTGCHGVTAVGDSIMIDAAPYLKALVPGIVVDGRVGRQMIQAPAVLARLRHRHLLGNCLIVELGTNGPFPPSMAVAMLRGLGPMHRIVLVNTRVPRPWQNLVNQTILQVARSVPHATVANWYAASADHPGYFWPDGVHLDPLGARAFARLVVRTLENPVKVR